MNYTMHIFGLILFSGMVSSSTIGQIIVVGILASELQSLTGLSSRTTLKTSTLSDENDNKKCTCTFYHLCIEEDRTSPCNDEFEVCCYDTNITSTEVYDYSSLDKSITLEHINTTEPNTPLCDTYKCHTHKCGTWNYYGIGKGEAYQSQIIEYDTKYNAGYGEFPFMVAIFKEELLSKDNEKKLVLRCGGSLIEKNVILTAAHCVIKEDISTFVVRAGEWDLTTDKEFFDHQDRRVSKIVIHPSYYAEGLHNDVALIFTEISFSLQKNIDVVCLSLKNETYIPLLCYASSWSGSVSYDNYTIVKNTESGNTDETIQHQSGVLKKFDSKIVRRSQCVDTLRATKLGPKFVLHDSFICADGYEGKPTFKGAGGDPLLCMLEPGLENLVQVGIDVSSGISSGLVGSPGIYVNLARFVDWIKYEIKKYT